MNLLYMSCHSVLEFYELSMFSELGYNVFSMGAYSNPNQSDLPRPAIPNLHYLHDLHSLYMQCSKENIHPHLVDWADVIVMMHNSRAQITDPPQPWLQSPGNWEKLKKKPVIWRSIGQSTREIETALEPFRKDGLRIVRYSPKEITIPRFQGQDAMIRFYGDENEFRDWNGNDKQIVNFTQNLAGRGEFCNYNIFMQVTEGFRRKVYGPDNQDLGNDWGGFLNYEEMKKVMRDSAVYFYVGTQPASYTLNFIEAWMTGVPIVAIGSKHGNSIFIDQQTYEVHELLENGEAGFWSDDIKELRSYIRRLLKEPQLAKQIGEKGRIEAIKHFGKDHIKEAWRDFLKNL